MNSWKKSVENLLEGTGIVLNGPNPWDPQIHDGRFYARVMKQGTLGLGESYMDGWWDCAALDEMIDRVLRANVQDRIRLTWPVLMAGISSVARNLQKKSRAFQIGEEHYDIGNDLYEAMLDKRLAYSCGYWKEATTLDEAQEAKLDLICRKLNLQKGQSILDIGCGWGSLIGYAAEKYGVSALGITVSKNQAVYAKQHYAHLPVEVRLADYRDIGGQFDHVVSVGMFEHVGAKNYREFFEVTRRVLKDDGLFLLHTIGSLKTSQTFDPWIEKYIFPNSMLPSLQHITKSAESLFVMEDWHSFGSDYDPTLMAWWKNFEAAWPRLKVQYNDRFYRMWRYYILTCAGSFRARKNQLWQIVLSPHGMSGGYRSIR